MTDPSTIPHLTRKLDPKHTGVNALGHVVNTKPAPGIANTPGPHNVVEDNDHALAHKGALGKLNIVSKYVVHGVAEAVKTPVHITEKLAHVATYKVASTPELDQLPASDSSSEPEPAIRLVPKVAKPHDPETAA